jgi:hypothetical protein
MMQMSPTAVAVAARSSNIDTDMIRGISHCNARARDLRRRRRIEGTRQIDSRETQFRLAQACKQMMATPRANRGRACAEGYGGCAQE